MNPLNDIGVPLPNEPLTLDALRAANVERCPDYGHDVVVRSLDQWLFCGVVDAGAVERVVKKLVYLSALWDTHPRPPSASGTFHQALARQLAAAVIKLDLLAEAAGIDLATAVRVAFNEKSEAIGSEVRL